jgi:YVTN family beta-propeller protein
MKLIKNNLLITLLITLLTFTISCQNDDEVTPLGKYSEGVLISNEGNFSDGDGSAAFYNISTSEVNFKIFENENGRPFGGLLQSIGIHGDYAYLINNLGSSIEIVDANTFESIKSILKGLSNPRYFASEGINGFISNWGPYAEDFSSPESFLAVLDTKENILGEQIEVPSRPEGLIASNGKLFVSSLASREITVIDISTNNITGSIEVGFGPSHFVQDKNGFLWVICSDGSLMKIDPATNTVLEEANIPNPSGKLAINGSGETLYILTSTYAPDFSFTENGVLKLNIASPQLQTEIFSAQNLYGIGVDPKSDIIYLANSNAFLGNGTVIRIDSEGREIDNFASGRGPNGFVFR